MVTGREEAARSGDGRFGVALAGDFRDDPKPDMPVRFFSGDLSVPENWLERSLLALDTQLESLDPNRGAVVFSLLGDVWKPKADVLEEEERH